MHVLRLETCTATEVKLHSELVYLIRKHWPRLRVQTSKYMHYLASGVVSAHRAVLFHAQFIITQYCHIDDCTQRQIKIYPAS